MSLTSYLDFCSRMYYEGAPVISDDEFDSLAEQANYLSVGFKAGNTLPHAFIMFSLQKVYPEDSLPFEGGYKSIKLDGAAVSLLYVNGKFTMALSRGDGMRGLDITENVKCLVPPTITDAAPIVQITGEVVAPATIKNARNYAAGALNLKSVEEFKTRQLYFVAHGLQPFKHRTYTEDMYWLIEKGFVTVLDVVADFFPTDGFVVRMESNKAFADAGYTSHHPRGAYALKIQKEGVVTKLTGVMWNVGRSGVVSPVAILDPVEIEGAVVSRATLHNMKYIEALGLEIGCQVKVIRSGDIIPRIVERVE